MIRTCLDVRAPHPGTYNMRAVPYKLYSPLALGLVEEYSIPHSLLVFGVFMDNLGFEAVAILCTYSCKY